MQERGEEAGGCPVPELLRCARSGIGVRDAHHGVRDLLGAPPRPGLGERRPRVRGTVGRVARVEDKDPPPSGGSRGVGVPEEVGLDGGADNGALPLEDRGDRQAGGLAGLGRAEHQKRRALLGENEAVRETPECRSTRLWLPGKEAFQVGEACPSRALGVRCGAARPGGQLPDAEGHCGECAEDREDQGEFGVEADGPRVAWTPCALSPRSLGFGGVPSRWRRRLLGSCSRGLGGGR